MFPDKPVAKPCHLMPCSAEPHHVDAIFNSILLTINSSTRTYHGYWSAIRLHSSGLVLCLCNNPSVHSFVRTNPSRFCSTHLPHQIHSRPTDALLPRIHLRIHWHTLQQLRTGWSSLAPCRLVSWKMHFPCCSSYQCSRMLLRRPCVLRVQPWPLLLNGSGRSARCSSSIPALVPPL